MSLSDTLKGTEPPVLSRFFDFGYYAVILVFVFGGHHEHTAFTLMTCRCLLDYAVSRMGTLPLLEIIA